MEFEAFHYAVPHKPPGDGNNQWNCCLLRIVLVLELTTFCEGNQLQIMDHGIHFL